MSEQNSSSNERLGKFGIAAPADAARADFLAGLSDNELEVLSGVQKKAANSRVASDDVGGSFF
jgi:hypothetical protein